MSLSDERCRWLKPPHAGLLPRSFSTSDVPKPANDNAEIPACGNLLVLVADWNPKILSYFRSSNGEHVEFQDVATLS